MHGAVLPPCNLGLTVASPIAVVAPAGPPRELPHAAAQDDQVGSETPRPERVLVVEDEWLVSMEVEALLDEAGYQVVGVAASADEAVRMAELHRPDLVLMDIRLIGSQDGVDAALEINRRFGLRCLFTSANNDLGTLKRAQAAYPLGWLTKPFSGQQLLDAVEAALGNLKG